MSDKYKLMIHYVHSTIIMYEKTIRSNRETTISEFIDTNKDVVNRVNKEAISVFNYELSGNQIEAGIAVYLTSKHNPQSVYETEVYKPN